MDNNPHINKYPYKNLMDTQILMRYTSQIDSAAEEGDTTQIDTAAEDSNTFGKYENSNGKTMEENKNENAPDDQIEENSETVSSTDSKRYTFEMEDSPLIT